MPSMSTIGTLDKTSAQTQVKLYFLRSNFFLKHAPQYILWHFRLIFKAITSGLKVLDTKRTERRLKIPMLKIHYIRKVCFHPYENGFNSLETFKR